MNLFRNNRIWQIAYPLIVYYVLYNLLIIMFGGIFPEWAKINCVLLSALLTLIPIWQIYANLPIVRLKLDLKTIYKDALWIIIIVVAGFLINILFTYFSKFTTTGYESATNTLYSGALIVRILATAVVIPALEELLFRGIICGQINLWTKKNWLGIIISSFLFGAMHFNVIQLVYAFLMGMLLALCYSKRKHILTVIIAHGLTNLIVILATI